MTALIQRFALLLAIVSLAACGGGGGGDVIEEVEVPDRMNGDTDPNPGDQGDDPADQGDSGDDPVDQGETGDDTVDQGETGDDTVDETDSGDTPSDQGAPDPLDLPNDDTPDDLPPDDVIPPDPPTDDMVSSFEAALAESATMDVPLDALIITQVNGGLQLERRAGVFDFDDGVARVGGVMASFLSDVPGTFAASSGFSAGNDSGLFGITTGADLMQTEGGARFTGGAVGLIIGPDGGVELRDGTSNVSVNFDDALLTATMSDFQIVDSETFVLVERPLDTITLRNAGVTGSSFAGGTLELRSEDNAVIDSTGANTFVQVEGQFFGTDASGMGADEVGGLIVAEGDDGQVFVQFLAD